MIDPCPDEGVSKRKLPGQLSGLGQSLSFFRKVVLPASLIVPKTSCERVYIIHGRILLAQDLQR